MKRFCQFIILSILAFGCQDQELIPEDLNDISDEVQKVQTSSSNKHINVTNTPMNVASVVAEENVSDDYTWTHIANVEPLEVNGQDLSATSILLIDNKAYVAYHKRGNIHMGAIEIIDLTDPETPVSEGYIPFVDYDINDIVEDPFETNTFWVAGSSNKIGATLFKMVLNNQGEVETLERINLSKHLSGGISASANGVYVSANYIFVSSGKSQGGVFKIDRNDHSQVTVDEFTGAKGVSGNEVLGIEYYANLSVNATSEITIKQVANEAQSLSITTSTSQHQSVDLPHAGKYELLFSETNPAELYFTSGSLGVQSMNIVTGETIKQTEENLLPKGNTNSLSMDEEFIYLANGEDGLSIALVEDAEESEEISPIFQWDLPEKPASVNFVTAKDGYVYVAKGLGGFHILKYKKIYKTVLPFDDQGTPIGLKEIEFCPDIITNVLTIALPEGENALTNSPEYFDNPNSSFYLETEAQVEITFLHEGAGYRNTLGYYTYNENDPPESILDLEKTVIFPNTSAKYSGGGLIPGNTVEVLGTFPAGTVFGFFLISDGWEGEITDGYYTQYSDWDLNLNKKQQNLIFYDEDCDAFVVCFEDVLIPRGDKDFNDAIFQVTSTPSEAFRKTAYLKIR